LLIEEFQFFNELTENSQSMIFNPQSKIINQQ